MSDSKWIISDTGNEATQPVFDFINEQIAFLCQETGGKVVAALEPAKKRWDEIAESITAAASFLTGAYPQTHHSGVGNAADLYKKSTYEFYIMDSGHNYELSVFQIVCNDTFPLTIVIEPSISEEAEFLSNRFVIEDFKRFERDFQSIVQTNKVRYIVSRLMNLASEE